MKQNIFLLYLPRLLHMTENPLFLNHPYAYTGDVSFTFELTESLPVEELQFGEYTWTGSLFEKRRDSSSIPTEPTCSTTGAAAADTASAPSA